MKAFLMGLALVLSLNSNANESREKEDSHFDDPSIHETYETEGSESGYWADYSDSDYSSETGYEDRDPHLDDASTGSGDYWDSQEF